MIGNLLALVLATNTVPGYEVSCVVKSCLVTSHQLKFKLDRVGQKLVIRPISILVRGDENHGKSGWIKEPLQFSIVPDFCHDAPNGCHYLFGPGQSVTKWSQRQDRAYSITTRSALREISFASKLYVSTFQTSYDVVYSVGADIRASEFIAAVRLAASKLHTRF